MRRSITSDFLTKTFGTVLIASSNIAWSEALPSQCPEDVCIPGFVEAQGGDVEFVKERVPYDLGLLRCETKDSAFSLSAYDSKTVPMITTSSFGSSRTVVSECHLKTPEGTTGIRVFECQITTQFANIDDDFKLKRHELTLSLVYPFLGEPYSFAFIERLQRDETSGLQRIPEIAYDPNQLTCETQHSPKLIQPPTPKNKD